MMRYFSLSEEMEIDGAWYPHEILDEQGHEILAPPFVRGKLFTPLRQLTVSQGVVGNPVDFRLTTFGVPIVSRAFADVVEQIAPGAIQRIPVTVAPGITGYEILNILTVLSCLDYERTKIVYYTGEDGILEDIGQIQTMSNITLKPELAAGHHIFRLVERWDVIVISETLKEALEVKKFTGIKIDPLNEVVV